MKNGWLFVAMVCSAVVVGTGCAADDARPEGPIGLPTRDDSERGLPPDAVVQLPNDGRTEGQGDGPSGEPILEGEEAPPPVTAPAPTTPFDGNTWKIATIIYRQTEVDVIDVVGGTPRHVSIAMSAERYAAARAAAAALPNAFSLWSGDNVRADVTVIDAPVLRSVSRPSTFEKGYWASPKDVAADLATFAPLGAFDSVFVLWEPNAPAGSPGVPVCCTWGRGPGADTNNMTFASVTPKSGTEGMMHEWLHGSTAFFRSKGLDVPDPHDNRLFGFPSSKNASWSHWYTALMSGRLVRQNKVVGFSRSVWRSGTPTRGVVAGAAAPRNFSLAKPNIRVASKHDADWLYAEWDPTQGPKEYSLFLSVIKPDGSSGKSIFKYDSGGTDRGAFNYFYWPMSEVCTLGKGTLKLRFQLWSADDDGSAVDRDVTGTVKCPQ